MRCPALLLASLWTLAACSTSGDPAAPDAAAVDVPPPPAWIAPLEARYAADVRVDGLEDRKFTPEHWWKVAAPLLTEARGFSRDVVAHSVQGRPLTHVRWGQGATQVLLWSQMHGDESTATMALADLFRFLGEHPDDPVAARLRRDTTLHVLPILNPDGAAQFQRRNAQGIDINRDARALASPEARALAQVRDQVRPAFAFNLHDQRVGYRAGASARGTAIALLAPPFNAARDVDAARARAMELAGVIRSVLEPRIGGHIARWDDTFNPRAFGDLTARSGASTLLIESGGIENDRQKQQLRKLNFLALVAALDAIATGSHAGMPRAVYESLPENGDVWPDLRINGATLVRSGRGAVRADVVVSFKDPLLEQGGTITDVGDLGDAPARRTIDASGLYLLPMPPPHAMPGAQAGFVPGAPAYFRLSRDRHGRQVVWTLAGDVDSAHPAPAHP